MTALEFIYLVAREVLPFLWKRIKPPTHEDAPLSKPTPSLLSLMIGLAFASFRKKPAATIRRIVLIIGSLLLLSAMTALGLIKIASDLRIAEGRYFNGGSWREPYEVHEPINHPPPSGAEPPNKNQKDLTHHRWDSLDRFVKEMDSKPR